MLLALTKSRGEFSITRLTLDRPDPTPPIQKLWSTESLRSEYIPWVSASALCPHCWCLPLVRVLSQRSSLLERNKLLFRYVSLPCSNNPKCSRDRNYLKFLCVTSDLREIDVFSYLRFWNSYLIFLSKMTENQLDQKAGPSDLLGAGYVECSHVRCPWFHSNNPFGSRSQLTASKILLEYPWVSGSHSYHLVRADHTIHILLYITCPLFAEVETGCVKLSN